MISSRGLRVLALVFVVLAVFASALSTDSRLSRRESEGREVSDSESPLASRIIGGSNAAPGEIPWQVYIVIGGHGCGGVVIDKNWILTAWHCFLRLPSYIHFGNIPKYLKMQTGDNYYPNRYWNPNRQVPKASKVIFHEGFNKSTFANDIVLIKLSSPFRFDKYTAKISLPTAKDNFDHFTCKMSGWGLTRSPHLNVGYNEQPWILKKILLPIIPLDQCKATHLRIDKKNVVFDNNLCTMHSEDRKGTCAGDSGGPLACPQTNGRWILAGILSWGQNVGETPVCGKKGYPDVYTKVSSFFDWIHHHTGIPIPDAS